MVPKFNIWFNMMYVFEIGSEICFEVCSEIGKSEKILSEDLLTFHNYSSGVYILAIFHPLEGGKKRGTFWSLGKKIGPSRKKI